MGQVAPIRTEVFWRDDIESILRAIDLANGALAVNLPVREVEIYRAGFRAALTAAAEAFAVKLDGQAQARMPRLPQWGG